MDYIPQHSHLPAWLVERNNKADEQSEGTVTFWLQSQIGLKFHFTEFGVIMISQLLKFHPVDGEHEVHLQRRKLCLVESLNAGWSLPFPQRNHSKLHAAAVNQSVYNGTRCFSC